jgi:hypothetical protein
MDLRKLKRPSEPEAPTNIVRGPWDQPAETPARRPKIAVWRRPAIRRGKGARGAKGEPMVNNWGRLALLLGLLFVLPPVASWLVHRVLQMMNG